MQNGQNTGLPHLHEMQEVPDASGSYVLVDQKSAAMSYPQDPLIDLWPSTCKLFLIRATYISTLAMSGA